LLEHRIGSSGQGIAVKNDRIHGKAVTSIEALGVVVGGIGGDRSSVCVFSSRPS
jgi:hypothetical protein